MSFNHLNTNINRLPAHGLRTLVLLSVFTLLLAPGIVYALGIKKPILKSYLNERLNIEIPVILTKQEQYSDIVIHQIVGKNENIKEWVPDLKFNLISDYDNNYTILATTDAPVREPIVHFTISIDTGYHWIQREMSFLLDPKPVQDLATQRAKNARSTTVLKPSEAVPRDKLGEARPVPVQPAPAPVPISVEPEPIQLDADSYTIRPGDSLSLIAQKFRQSRDVTTHQAMLAIYRANPRAFINNNINFIKSHYTIAIPDEAQMKQLSASEARNLFGELLAGAAPAIPALPVQAPVASVPARPAKPEPIPAPPTVAEPPPAIPAAPAAQAEPVVMAPPAPEQAMVEPPPAPIPAVVEEDFRLTLSSENGAISQQTINENAGTLVYQGPETAVTRAASPSPEVKQAMRAAVTDMEQELLTLRDEVKKLRQTLQGKENLLALRSETRLRSLSTEEPQAPTSEVVPEPVAPVVSPATAPEQPDDTAKPAVIELDGSVTGQAGGSFDYFRLFLEILTVVAALAFIGYLIILQRKGDETEEFEFSGRLAKVKGFKTLFKPPRKQSDEELSEEYDETEEDFEDDDGIRRKRSSYVHSDEESVRSFMRSQGKTQDGIEVSEEAYDESLDFSHDEKQEEQQEEVRSIDGFPASVPLEEGVKPDFLLQEANLSIAFSDFENAHPLLIKLINYDPRNPEYRLLILKVLKELAREEEFLYHANHLARLTNKSINSEWQEAYEYGLEFLPRHPLFATPPTGIESAIIASQRGEHDQARPPAQQAAAPGKPNNLSFEAKNTVVLDTRKALAEHERRIREQAAKGQLPDDKPLQQPAATAETDNKEEDIPFHLNIGSLTDETEQPPTPEETGVFELPGEPASDDLISSRQGPTTGEYKVSEVALKPQKPRKTKDEDHILEFDSPTTAPESAASALESRQPDIANVLEFEGSPEHPDEPPLDPDSKEAMARELEDHLTEDALASMAEFAAIEGITLDEELLKLDQRLSREKKEEK